MLIDNDVNIMALGERHAHLPDVDDLVFVKVGTGIGAGIISGGVLQRGAQGTAGDLGHVRVARADGVFCRCGNEGCLEAIAAGPAVGRGAARGRSGRRATSTTWSRWRAAATRSRCRRCARPGATSARWSPPW